MVSFLKEWKTAHFLFEINWRIKFEHHCLQRNYDFLSNKSCGKKRNESKEPVLKLFLSQMDQNDFDSVFDGMMKCGNSKKKIRVCTEFLII